MGGSLEGVRRKGGCLWDSLEEGWGWGKGQGLEGSRGEVGGSGGEGEMMIWPTRGPTQGSFLTQSPPPGGVPQLVAGNSVLKLRRNGSGVPQADSVGASRVGPLQGPQGTPSLCAPGARAGPPASYAYAGGSEVLSPLPKFVSPSPRRGCRGGPQGEGQRRALRPRSPPPSRQKGASASASAAAEAPLGTPSAVKGDRDREKGQGQGEGET